MLKLEERTEYKNASILSLKDLIEKTKPTTNLIKESLEQTNPYFDYNESNIFGTGWLQREVKEQQLGQEDYWNVLKTVRSYSLKDFFGGMKIKEFLARSGTSGIAGGIYLIPVKIYQILFDSAKEEDIVAEMSMRMIGADEIGGATMDVAIEVDDSFKPKKYTSGGAIPVETMAIEQATLDFTNPFGLNIAITNDMIEDSQFDMMEVHIGNAGREMGEFATNEACLAMISGADGDGVQNVCTSRVANTTVWYDATLTSDDIEDAIMLNDTDGFNSNTMVTSHHCMVHDMMRSTGTLYTESPVVANFLTSGWPTKLGPLNIYYSNCDAITNTKAYTTAKTLVFDKNYAMLSGRKRWLRLEKYSDPIRDLAGAVVTARQDSVTIYNDASCEHSES